MSQRIEIPETGILEYNEESLIVSELFWDTIQGEGVWTGQPAVFLRLAGCTLSCSFCDSAYARKKGHRYQISELIDIFMQKRIIQRLRNGHHLVLTGGSPLLQQTALITFLRRLHAVAGFLPYVEVENECVIVPTQTMQVYVRCWNNSPKLRSSGNSIESRFKPDIIKYMSDFTNSYFKFVIKNERDWIEVKRNYLDTRIVKKEEVILMPMAANKKELHEVQDLVSAIACANGIRYNTRLHIEMWDSRRFV